MNALIQTWIALWGRQQCRPQRHFFLSIGDPTVLDGVVTQAVPPRFPSCALCGKSVNPQSHAAQRKRSAPDSHGSFRRTATHTGTVARHHRMTDGVQHRLGHSAIAEQTQRTANDCRSPCACNATVRAGRASCGLTKIACRSASSTVAESAKESSVCSSAKMLSTLRDAS